MSKNVDKLVLQVLELMINYVENCKSRCAYVTTNKLTSIYINKFRFKNNKLSAKSISTIAKNVLVFLSDIGAIRPVDKCSRGIVYMVCKNDLELIKRLIQDFV